MNRLRHIPSIKTGDSLAAQSRALAQYLGDQATQPTLPLAESANGHPGEKSGAV